MYLFYIIFEPLELFYIPLKFSLDLKDTSQWTLDYPPFFAWFEYVLSHIANIFDKDMLVIENLEYASGQTILFQRLSVIVCDLLLVYAIIRHTGWNLYTKDFKDVIARSLSPSGFIVYSIIFNFGLFIVDHIHFQYNGFLFGILIMSVSSMTKGKHLQSAFWFMILLNFKHIFLYIAPVYFVFLLRSYCFKNTGKPLTGIWSWLGLNPVDLFIFNTIKLAAIVISIFALSFGPFVYFGQLTQVFSRLFPVKRGLCHAYWAANFWACYNLMEKFAIFVVKKLGLKVVNIKSGSMTGGLVAQQDFQVLPNITPIVTVVITLIFMMPVLLKLWYRPFRRDLFVPALVCCGYASFLFGYHVHEKAILMVIIPLTLIAPFDRTFARAYIIVQTFGHYALLPLLFQQAESPIKCAMFIIYTLLTLYSFKHIFRIGNFILGIPLVTWYEALYIYGLIPLYIFTDLVHPHLKMLQNFEFLPLLMTSLYCSIGIIWSFAIFFYHYLFHC